MLQPVQRALVRCGSAVLALGRELAGEGREHRVMAQLLMVEQILPGSCFAGPSAGSPEPQPGDYSPPTFLRMTAAAGGATRDWRRRGRMTNRSASISAPTSPGASTVAAKASSE